MLVEDMFPAGGFVVELDDEKSNSGIWQYDTNEVEIVHWIRENKIKNAKE